MSDTTDRMQEAAQSLAVVLPPGTGFILLAFDFNQSAEGESRLDYVSNAQRADALNVMKSFLKKNISPEAWARHLR
jgi:hypothetical protein